VWYGAVAEGGGGGAGVEEGEGSEEERAKRNELRLALARRMKQDLLLTEQEKLAKMQVQRPHTQAQSRISSLYGRRRCSTVFADLCYVYVAVAVMMVWCRRSSSVC
jgi:hypothetical protein